MKKLFVPFAVAVAAIVLSAAAPPAHTWLDLVAPVITPAEKKAYLQLSSAERAKYEEEFWAHKSISLKEYTERLAYVDNQFGSTKFGSGANTDQGRVYLSLGAPNKITHIPSSRKFYPVEIWYYSIVPGVLNTEVHLMFYSKNGVGLPHLYSPTRDTIRALLIPQSSNMNLFGPNDDLNEEQIRNAIQAAPAEDEIISASVNVAAGVRYEENDTILGEITSPSFILGRPSETDVKSRLITSHPRMDTVRAHSPYGGSQIDLKLELSVRDEIDIEVTEGDVSVYHNQLKLKFDGPQPVTYMHRLDLLAGSYRVILKVDGTPAVYNLDVPESSPKIPEMGDIQRVALTGDVSGRQTPFEFDGQQLQLNPLGAYVMVPLPHPGKVTWMIRHGGELAWRDSSEGQQVAVVALPTRGIEPGEYKIEALMDDTSISGEVTIGKDLGKEAPTPSKATVVSFNANLAPARRYAFVGHQWLLRNNLSQARLSLNASLSKGLTDEVRIELARVDALSGNLDTARESVENLLKGEPNNFEALTVLAYIETRFQDYPVAAQLYRRALTVQDSPAVRAALAKLPPQ